MKEAPLHGTSLIQPAWTLCGELVAQVNMASGEITCAACKESLAAIAADKNTCCLCGGPVIGYGHNAEPAREGTCCDACNNKVVLPARTKQLKEAVR